MHLTWLFCDLPRANAPLAPHLPPGDLHVLGPSYELRDQVASFTGAIATTSASIDAVESTIGVMAADGGGRQSTIASVSTAVTTLQQALSNSVALLEAQISSGASLQAAAASTAAAAASANNYACVPGLEYDAGNGVCRCTWPAVMTTLDRCAAGWLNSGAHRSPVFDHGSLFSPTCRRQLHLRHLPRALPVGSGNPHVRSCVRLEVAVQQLGVGGTFSWPVTWPRRARGFRPVALRC